MLYSLVVGVEATSTCIIYWLCMVLAKLYHCRPVQKTVCSLSHWTEIFIMMKFTTRFILFYRKVPQIIIAVSIMYFIFKKFKGVSFLKDSSYLETVHLTQNLQKCKFLNIRIFKTVKQYWGRSLLVIRHASYLKKLNLWNFYTVKQIIKPNDVY